MTNAPLTTAPRGRLGTILVVIGTALFVVGGTLAIAALYVGNGGNPLFYWAYTEFQGRLTQLVVFFIGLVLAVEGVIVWIVAALVRSAGQRAA